MGILPTGKDIDVMGIDVVRIEDGQITERWANVDVFTTLQQVGVDPQGAQ